MRKQRSISLGVALLAITTPALAGSHMWRFSEVFSNAAGNIQFIEMYCLQNGENFISNHSVVTSNGTYTFPENLIGFTNQRYLLLATADFAALPGAPTPDYIIPPNFIRLSGDTMRYHPAGNYDKWTYGAGVIPVNGSDSVRFLSWNGTGLPDDPYVLELNSPTNWNGETGSVNAGCLDNDGDGFGVPGDPNCPGGPQTDCDDSNPDARPNGTENEASANCGDGADNDCDGQADCADAACESAIGPCVPTISEWGVAVLMLTIVCAGSVMLRGRIEA